MKKWLPVLALPALLAAAQAHAQVHGGDERAVRDDRAAGHVVERLRGGDAEFGITSRDGKLSLLLSPEGVTMQLTDRTLREIDRDMDEDARDEDGALGRMISSMVRGSVRSLLDHGYRYGYDEIRDVRYEDGRLRITGVDGTPLLEHVKVDDDDAMRAFSPSDAREFVRQFERLRARRWI
jgi:hypothetical protein